MKITRISVIGVFVIAIILTLPEGSMAGVIGWAKDRVEEAIDKGEEAKDRIDDPALEGLPDMIPLPTSPISPEDLKDGVKRRAEQAKQFAKDVKEKTEQLLEKGKEETFKIAANKIVQDEANRLIETVIASVPSIKEECFTPETMLSKLTSNIEDPSRVEEVVKSVTELLVGCSPLAGVIDEARKQNYGSLLIMAATEGGYGVSAGNLVGVAISLSPDTIGRWGSVFVAGGVGLGTVGASADIILGFNRNTPDGVGGGAVDVALEVKGKLGAGIIVSFDPQLPPNASQLSVVLGAGLKVRVSVGAGFAYVIRDFKFLIDPKAVKGSEVVYLSNGLGCEQNDSRCGKNLSWASDLNVQLYPRKYYCPWEMVPISGKPGQFYLNNLWHCPEEEIRCRYNLSFSGTNAQLWNRDDKASHAPWEFVSVPGKPGQFYIINRWNCGTGDPQCGKYLSISGDNVELSTKKVPWKLFK